MLLTPTSNPSSSCSEGSPSFSHVSGRYSFPRGVDGWESFCHTPEDENPILTFTFSSAPDTSRRSDSVRSASLKTSLDSEGAQKQVTNRTSDSAEAMIDDRRVVTDSPVPTWNALGVEDVSKELNGNGESTVVLKLEEESLLGLVRPLTNSTQRFLSAREREFAWTF